MSLWSTGEVAWLQGRLVARTRDGGGRRGSHGEPVVAMRLRTFTEALVTQATHTKVHTATPHTSKGVQV